MNSKEEYYPGKDYQRLFDLINESAPNPLESQLQDIIRVVHEDFPDEAKDNFAIAFACWLKGEEGQMYEATGMTAYNLLMKYKDRPYIDTNPNNQ